MQTLNDITVFSSVVNNNISESAILAAELDRVRDILFTIQDSLTDKMMSKKLLLLFVIVMLAVSLNESAPRASDSNLHRLLMRVLKAKRMYENDPEPCSSSECYGDIICCDGWHCGSSPKSKVQSPKSKVQSPKSKVQSPVHVLAHATFKLRSAREFIMHTSSSELN
ncbi:hypothetical protein AC249_AIPGENE23942 [Exaiptasia diaphana]|nr:hypothetical protein AC249_AIPGENE23942 [Exaiptasia diaphana]